MEEFLPEVISNWIAEHPARAKDLARYERLKSYAGHSFENMQALQKAWKALEAATVENPNDPNDLIIPESLLNMFVAWPDEPKKQLYPGIFGLREHNDPADEKEEYQRLADKVRDVVLAFKADKLRPILADVPNNDIGEAALEAWRACDTVATKATLRALLGLLDVADPYIKYPTKQPGAHDADFKNYIIQLAGLNKYLRNPKWAAIATIANANYQQKTVTAKAIQRASEHMGDRLI